MIAILRADDTRTITIGDGDRLTVPDIKIPEAVEWSASLTDHGVAIITLEYESRHATILLGGPYSIGPGTYYIAQAPRRILQFLKNRLGDGNAMLLIDALRRSQALRDWARAQGFRLQRNTLGNPVGIFASITICGSSPVDLDGQDVDEAPEMRDLESAI